MPDWLELELAEDLRPTAAPDELWERIRGAAQVGQALPPANISSEPTPHSYLSATIGSTLVARRAGI